MSRPFLKDSNSKNALYDWLKRGMLRYSTDSMLYWADEDYLCGHFFSSISGACSFDIGKFNVKSYKLRGRGPSAPEKKIGADGIGIVILKYKDIQLQGFFLYQAKKAKNITDGLGKAKEGCDLMLSHTPASYLLVLMPEEIKMVGAMAVSANRKKYPSLNDLPFVSYPRFVIEHLLHGLMLEPLEKFRPTLSADLNGEIKNLTTIIGGSNQYIKDVERTLEEKISDLISHDIEEQNKEEKDNKNER
jgi:hypothetical protein